MKNRYTTLIAGCVFFLTALISCDNQGYDDYDAGSQPTEALNGEWFIDISDEAGNVYVSHALHKTYDFNGNLFITDREGSSDSFTGWWLESQLEYNLDALTFSATDAENTADGSFVTITEGKILKDAAHSPSGVVVDSIYFKGVFDYDPETVLIFSGFRRTGFEEDE
jgi:Lipid-binding putative hydrolase